VWFPRASSTAFFVALLASALMLGPALAHAFELPNKIGLTRDDYFVVQQIYRGWNGFGVLLVVQVIALLATAFLVRRQPRAMVPTVLAILFVAGSQALFWIHTYPANVATVNWTLQVADWDTLRHQWEYSHAAGAALQVLAMSCLIIAALARLPPRQRSYHHY
jgi:hypothetical protein